MLLIFLSQMLLKAVLYTYAFIYTFNSAHAGGFLPAQT